MSGGPHEPKADQVRSQPPSAPSSEGYKPILPLGQPAATAFLDETGSIAQDRFFAVGCLTLPQGSHGLREVQKIRDRHHWYGEIHWIDLTRKTLPLYREVIQAIVESGSRFTCFVADREVADPVARFRLNPWLAYEKLATQLLVGASRKGELISLLADNYSTPDDVILDQQIRDGVNRRLGGTVVVTSTQLDSKSSDGLQVVDLLTGAVAFEFRQAAGLAGTGTPKAELAAFVRELYSVVTFTNGIRKPRISVAIYRGNQ